MRLLVPRNRLVTLSILAAVLTGLVTVGLADPSLIPGSNTSPADVLDIPGSGGSSGAGLAAAVDGSSGTATPAATAAAVGSAAATPTPRPNFTPAVSTPTPRRGEDHERSEHEGGEWGDD